MDGLIFLWLSHSRVALERAYIRVYFVYYHDKVGKILNLSKITNVYKLQAKAMKNLHNFEHYIPAGNFTNSPKVHSKGLSLRSN